MNNILQKLIDLIRNFILKTSIAPIDMKDPLTPPKLVLTPPVNEVNKHKPVETMQELVLRICKEKGLSFQQTNDLYNTVRIESGFNNEAIHKNTDGHGKVLSTDYFLCQINDAYHIAPSKDFYSVQYVHDNPDAVLRWMCNLWLKGHANWWCAYSSGAYKKGYQVVV